MTTVLDKIRAAIEGSGQTRYRIWQETGITQAQLARLMKGQTGLSIEAMERLADCLGLEIIIRPKTGKGKSNCKHRTR